MTGARRRRRSRPTASCAGADQVVDARRRSAAGGRSSWPPTSTARCSTPPARSARAPAPRSSACWDAGIPVVGVTGRGPRLLDSVRVALDGRGIAVLAQGGFVVDLERDEVLRTVGLPRDQAAAVIERIEAVAGELDRRRRGRRRAGRGARPAARAARLRLALPRARAPAAAARGAARRAPSSRSSCARRRSARTSCWRRAQRVVDPADAEVTHAGLGFIEVLPPGITKATGLAVALERYGVGFGDVLVFGDMPNDLPMIARGRRGRRPRGGRGQRAPRRPGGGAGASPAATTSTASPATSRRSSRRRAHV